MRVLTVLVWDTGADTKKSHAEHSICLYYNESSFALVRVCRLRFPPTPFCHRRHRMTVLSQRPSLRRGSVLGPSALSVRSSSKDDTTKYRCSSCCPVVCLKVAKDL